MRGARRGDDGNREGVREGRAKTEVVAENESGHGHGDTGRGSGS
jgi:hypothetical protein